MVASFAVLVLLFPSRSADYRRGILIDMTVQLTRSAVRRAGSMVRKYSQSQCTREEFEPHLDTIVLYRASFTQPLASVHSRLIDIHAASAVHGEITRRLKKSSTILNKLVREPKLDLSRMQDIGGCRAVVKTREDLYRLAAKVAMSWEARVTDYVDDPRKSGYRAIHVIVVEDGKQIEIQLRTEQMHEWAETVEAFSSLIGDNYKQDGDHLIQRYMHALSELMAAAETRTIPSEEALDIVNELRPQVSAFLNDALRATEKETRHE